MGCERALKCADLLHLQHSVSGLTLFLIHPSLRGSPSLSCMPLQPSPPPPDTLPPGTHEGGALALFSLALGAQRARLRPFSRWQHLLLLGTVQAELRRHPARGQLVSPASSLWSPVRHRPTTHHPLLPTGPHHGGLVRNPTPGARGLCPPRPLDPLHVRCRQCGIVKVALGGDRAPNSSDRLRYQLPG